MLALSGPRDKKKTAKSTLMKESGREQVLVFWPKTVGIRGKRPAHSCVTHCLVILAQGPRHAIHKQARWGGWSQLCLGRERADHARGSRRVRKPACTLLTRAPQPSPKPTRESTLLTRPECATSGCSDASSEYPRVVWSRRSSHGRCACNHESQLFGRTTGRRRSRLHRGRVRLWQRDSWKLDG